MRGKFPAAMILNILTILFLIIAAGSAQSTPSFQSVSGEFAQKWIKNYTVNDPVPVTSSEGNGSDLWNWGSAPRGSKIVGGKLITDPYYLRPLLNLSSNWLGEAYTDEDTGLPVETYSDPLTGKNYYNILNPNNRPDPIFVLYLPGCHYRQAGLRLCGPHDRKRSLCQLGPHRHHQCSGRQFERAEQL